MSNASMPEKRPLVSPDKVAEHLGLSTKTVRRRIADGTVPAYRVGRLIKIDLAEAERALLRPIEAGGGETSANIEIPEEAGA